MTLTEVIQFLLDNDYVNTRAGKLAFTKKFHEDHIAQKGGVVTASISGALIPIPTTHTQMASLFVHFIMEAKVPAKLEDNRGNPYYANKFNEEAGKRFVQMIFKDGVDYNLLVKSTMLYYKSGVAFKKAISNYILQGDWLTDYQELQQSAAAGETQLNQHIKTTVEHGGYNPFKFG